jgi:hypothetical protein
VAEVRGIQILYPVVMAAQGFVSLTERDWLQARPAENWIGHAGMCLRGLVLRPMR